MIEIEFIISFSIVLDFIIVRYLYFLEI